MNDQREEHIKPYRNIYVGKQKKKWFFFSSFNLTGFSKARKKEIVHCVFVLGRCASLLLWSIKLISRLSTCSSSFHSVFGRCSCVNFNADSRRFELYASTSNFFFFFSFQIVKIKIVWICFQCTQNSLNVEQNIFKLLFIKHFTLH